MTIKSLYSQTTPLLSVQSKIKLSPVLAKISDVDAGAGQQSPLKLAVSAHFCRLSMFLPSNAS